MSLTLSISNVTATTAQLNYSSITGSPSILEVQISPRADFSFCVCPIFVTATSSPQSAAGLNQLQTYFARARGVTGPGVRLEWSNVVMFRTLLSAGQDLTVPNVFLDPAIICLPASITDLTWNGAEVAGYPVANLLDDGPSATCVVGSGGTFNLFYLTFRTAGQPIDTIALLNSNFAEAATVTIYSADTQADAIGGTGSSVVRYNNGPARASANLPGRMGYHGLYRFTETSQHWWHIVITTLVPASILQVGHLVAGKSIVSKRIARDMGTTFEDLGVMERNTIGIPDRQNGLRMRTVDFDIATLTETLYETLYNQVHARVGNTDPVLVVPNPKAGAFLHDRMLYGNLSGGRVTNPVSKYHTRRFQINSII